jgi:hypothetical protein
MSRHAFQTLVSRHYGPNRSIPASPSYSDLQLTKDKLAEIEVRFQALKLCPKPGTPSLVP